MQGWEIIGSPVFLHCMRGLQVCFCLTWGRQNMKTRPKCLVILNSSIRMVAPLFFVLLLISPKDLLFLLEFIVSLASASALSSEP